MSDFLGGLADVLSGFHQKRRIDKEGFDWREQDAARQFTRDREVQLAGQQDEDRAVGQIADVLASQDGEPDTSAIPEQVLGSQKEWRVRQALGKLPERKSQIEAAKAYAQSQRDQFRGDQQLAVEKLKGLNRLKAIAATGDEREAIVRLQEDLLSDREPNPRDKYLASQAAQRAQAGGAGKPQLRQTDSGEYAWLYPPSGPGQAGPVVQTGARAPLPATQRESQARGTTALATIANIEGLLSRKPENEDWSGPVAGFDYRTRSGQGIPGFLGDVLDVDAPSGERALFVTELASLGNRAVQDITGANVGQHEVPRLFTEIPNQNDRGEVLTAKLAVTKYRLGLLEQVRNGQITREDAINQINSVSSETILNQYRQSGISRGAPAPAASGSRYQKKRVQ